MRGFRWPSWPTRPAATAFWLVASTALSSAYKLDVNSTDSLKSVAKTMAEDMMSFYNGNQPGGTPGLLPQPYYWWEAGAMMGTLIDYWYYTGDTQYNNATSDGLLFQVGPNNDYMPPNQTMTEGNDDQGFWGMSVMTAAEYNFPNPPANKPQWLALAQAVFNTQAARWDTANCGGGLRWQIFQWNNGFGYKNSISQGCFFNVAARLARYTGNQSYAHWADKVWDWMEYSKYLDNKTYYIYDGSSITNCSDITPYQWTYNAGTFLLGAAAMYSYTNGTARQAVWKERVDGLLNGTAVFFVGNHSNIMSEVACEPVNLCDLDQQSFKAYLSRWMAATTKWAPYTYDRIKPLLESSAIAAASQCTGGSNGRMCGLKWVNTNNGTTSWDGSTGVGQQMAAMEIVLANMIQHVSAPVTNETGGTSVGDPGAGGNDVGVTNPHLIANLPPMTAADRAGAAICTILALAALIGSILFMFIDEAEDKTAKERLADLRSSAAGGGAAILRKLRKRSGTSNGTTLETTEESADTPTMEKDFVIETHYFLGEKGDNDAPPQGFYAPSPLGPVGPLPTPPALISDSPTKRGRHKSLVLSRLSAGTGGPPAYWTQDDGGDAVRDKRLTYPAANGKERKKVKFGGHDAVDPGTEGRASMAP